MCAGCTFISEEEYRTTARGERRERIVGRPSVCLCGIALGIRSVSTDDRRCAPMDEHLPRRRGEAEAGAGEGAAGGMAGGKLLPYGLKCRSDRKGVILRLRLRMTEWENGQIATVVERLTALCLPRNDTCRPWRGGWLSPAGRHGGRRRRPNHAGYGFAADDVRRRPIRLG